MTALIIIVWAIIGAAIGIVIGGVIAPGFGYRDMEGMSGIFAVLFIAPIGALASALLGLKVARKYAAERQKIVAFSILGIVTAIIAGFAFEFMTNDMLKQSSTLIFEVRSPAGTPMPAWDKISGHLRSKGNDGSSISSYADTARSHTGNTLVLQGTVAVWRQTTDRFVTFRAGDGPVHLFRINAPAKPVETKEMSAWTKTEFIEEGETKRAPKEGEALEIRYRIN